MASYKGWTKMDEYSWRHDGNNQGANKLNIFLKDEDEFKNIGEHVADVDISGGGNTYLLVYTVNDSPSDYDSGSQVLSEHSTLDTASKAATTVRKNNPESVPL